MESPKVFKNLHKGMGRPRNSTQIGTFMAPSLATLKHEIYKFEGQGEIYELYKGPY